MAVALGENYTLAVTSNGDVIATPKVAAVIWGLPLSLDVPVLLDKKIFGGEHVTLVAAKFGHCACVTEEGSVWAWGASLRREFAREWPPVLISTKSLVSQSLYVMVTLSPAVMVTCHIQGIMILTADGCIRVRGLYDIYSVAQKIGVPEPKCYPSSCFGSVRIDMIASGKGHAMAIGGGKLWTWAVANVFDKSFYPLGRGNYLDSIEFPHELTSREMTQARSIMYRPGLVSQAAFQNRNIVFIAAGVLSSFAVTEDGVLYSWGGAEMDPDSFMALPAADALHVRNGYLGVGITESTNIPQRVGGSDVFDGAGVRQVTCGKSHMLVLTTDNRIWSAGSDETGQLGLDQVGIHPETSRLVPFPVNMRHFGNKTVVLVAAGASHSAAVTKCGRMYLWGETNILQAIGCKTENESGGSFLEKNFSIMKTPVPVPISLFGGARVGLWNGLSRENVLALAMAMHNRLGLDSSAVFSDDILHRIAHTYTRYFDFLGQGLRTFMGLNE